MVTVGDIREYLWCGRSLWLRRKARIEIPNVGFAAGRKFHTTVRDITELIVQSFKAIIPGTVVGTEVSLTRGDLWGRIDLIRELEEDGRKVYIIQDHKFSDPPRDRWVLPEDKIQLDGYAYLVEASKFTPIKSAILLYADIVPREIKPEPERIPDFLERMNKILKSDILPPRGLWGRDKEMGTKDKFEKCHICRYYPLCQVLPVTGGITLDEIMAPRFREEEKELRRQLEMSIERLKR